MKIKQSEIHTTRNLKKSAEGFEKLKSLTFRKDFRQTGDPHRRSGELYPFSQTDRTENLLLLVVAE